MLKYQHLSHFVYKTNFQTPHTSPLCKTPAAGCGAYNWCVHHEPMSRGVSRSVCAYQQARRGIIKPRLSSTRKSADIVLSGDGLTATGCCGYRTALSTHGLSFGKLYFEMEVKNGCGAARVGIATLSAEINGPVGMDMQGYSYGSRNGYAFHMSRRKRYGTPYGYRDTVGVFVVASDGPTILEDSEDHVERNDVSYIRFSKNGKELGIAYSTLPSRVLYPAVSLYDGCCVTFNFGPYFAFPPHELDSVL